MFKSLISSKAKFSPITRLSQKLHFCFGHTALKKVVNSIDEALEGLSSGHKLLIGGFGLGGIPENLIRAVAKRKDLKDLTVVTCTGAIPSHGSGVLITNGLCSRVQTCYTGEHQVFEQKYINGELAVEFIPQGSLVERCRSAAMGIPAFYTPAGVGTYVETGGFPVKFKKGTKEVEEYSKPKEKRTFNGREYILEEAISGDFSLIKAHKADAAGNLYMRKASKNFNQDMAGASKITVAEVEEILPEGQYLDGTDVHVPGIFVDRVVKGPYYENIVGRVFYQTDKGIVLKGSGGLQVKQKAPEVQKIREKIARRAAKEISNGMYVNLGIGIPTIVRSFLPPDVKIVLQGENGILDIGPYPQPGGEDADLINAGNEGVTAMPGASFFQSSVSFGMYRGRHMSATILGGMQISKKGDIANWVIPNRLIKGMGGAMDLVSSGIKVIVCMEHCNRKGQPKILERCTLPLTGVGVVKVLVTDMAVFNFENGEMILKEVASDHSLEEVIEKTGCEFTIPDNIGSF